MIYKIYKVIDSLESSSLKKRLDKVKEEIRNDKNKINLINNFNIAKENFEKYGLKEEFIKAKTELFKDEVIGNYLKIQDEINMLSMYINKRIKDITKK